MCLTKVLSLFLVLIVSLPGFAQEASSSADAEEIHPSLRRRTYNWGVGLSSLSWNDKLALHEGTQSDTKNANYNGFIVTLQKEYNILRWGYTVGLFAGVGQANGGDTSSAITYQKSKVNFSIFGLSPRGFYRLNEKISLGTSALIFSKGISWPEDPGQTIDAGSNINATILADLNIRILKKWDFYQGFGPLAEGATLWKLGVNYRF